MQYTEVFNIKIAKFGEHMQPILLQIVHTHDTRARNKQTIPYVQVTEVLTNQQMKPMTGSETLK